MEVADENNNWNQPKRNHSHGILTGKKLKATSALVVACCNAERRTVRTKPRRVLSIGADQLWIVAGELETLDFFFANTVIYQPNSELFSEGNDKKGEKDAWREHGSKIINVFIAVRLREEG